MNPAAKCPPHYNWAGGWKGGGPNVVPRKDANHRRVTVGAIRFAASLCLLALLPPAPAVSEAFHPSLAFSLTAEFAAHNRSSHHEGGLGPLDFSLVRAGNSAGGQNLLAHLLWHPVIKTHPGTRPRFVELRPPPSSGLLLFPSSAQS